MSIENLEEIQTYMDTNKDNADVKTYLDTFRVQPTLEAYKGLTTTNADYKSFMDSEKDKHSAKGLETWKTNNLSKAVDDEVNKRFPKADPKDVEFAKYKSDQEKANAETKAMIAKMQSDSAHKDLTNKALQYASEKKLPADLVGYFIGADQETTDKNLEKLMATMAKHDEAIKTEFAKGNSYIPPDDKGTASLTEKEKIQAEIKKNMHI